MSEALVGVGGTVVGVTLGALLSTLLAARQERRQEASLIIRELPGLADNFWSATRREMTGALDRFDARLALAGVPEENRSGFRFAAEHCWQDWYDDYKHGDPGEAGINRQFLEAYDEVRRAITSELLAKWWQRPARRAATRKAVERSRQVVKKWEELLES